MLLRNEETEQDSEKDTENEYENVEESKGKNSKEERFSNGSNTTKCLVI